MNLSPEWAAYLQTADLDATHWSSVGAGNALDLEIMSWAAAMGYVILTQDLDFSAMLAATRAQKPSVILIREPTPDPERIGEIVLRVIQEEAVNLELGALVSVDTRRARLRLLPL